MLKKLKSFFVIEEDKDSDEPSSNESAIVPPSSTKKRPVHTETPSSSPIPTSTSDSAPVGKVTQKFLDVLLRAMDKNNLDGFDYLEFKQSLQSLESMNMDEATRYQSAFAMAKTMGATSDKLTQAALHYIKVLQDEEQKFGQALANQRAKQIGNKEQEVKDIGQLVKNKMVQIEILQKEIAQSKKRLDATKKEIHGAKMKVETTKNNFEVTFKRLVGKIQTDINNIKKYLK